jgi:cytidyltransferase-like protein
MNPNAKSVFVTGAFDDIGTPHIRFLEEASKLGELTVLLWSDAEVQRHLGKAPKFPESERLYFLNAVRYVSRVEFVADAAQETALLAAPEAKLATWVARESDGPDTKALFERHQLAGRVLGEEDLRGFPNVLPAPSAGDPTRKKVIVTGCYDWLHSGHVRFFEEVSAHGDLYVIVGHDANIRLLKGEGRPLFPQEQRRYLVGSIRHVKQALISSGDGWLDAEPEIEQLRPDIYAVNEDGDRPEKRDYCAKQGIQYLVLQRAPAPGLPKRSSTDLRRTL